MVKAFSCDYEVNKKFKLHLRKYLPGEIRKTKHWWVTISVNDRMLAGEVSDDFLVWVLGKSERILCELLEEKKKLNI